MHWLVLISAVLFVTAVAALFAGLAGWLVESIRPPTLRKWLMILATTGCWFFLALLCILVYFAPDDREKFARKVGEAYHALPTSTVLVLSVVAAEVLSLVGFFVASMWPRRGEPYAPRGAQWSLAGICKAMLAAGVLLIAALVGQDIELGWRLMQMESESLELARQMAPTEVIDAENAAPIYERLMNTVDELKALGEQYPGVDRGMELCACDSPRRAEYFAKMADLLKGFRETAGLDQCTFSEKAIPVDLLDAMDARYSLTSAARSLTLLARYEACQQRPTEAIAHLQSLRRLLEHMAMDRRGGDSVEFFWIEAWICHAVEQLVTYNKSLPVDAARALMIGPLDVDPIYRDGAKWQAAVFQMHVVKTHDGRNFDRPDLKGELKGGPVGRGMQLALMRLFFARDDMRAMRAYFPFVDDPNRPQNWVEQDWTEIFPEGHLLPSIATSSWASGYLERANGWRQLTNIALACGLYRQEHDAWPVTMEQLAPTFLTSVPIDPLSGKPYLWKSIDDGLIVYSEVDAEHYKDFSDTDDSWKNLYHATLYGSLFLGQAYSRHSAAGYEDPNDPCKEPEKLF